MVNPARVSTVGGRQGSLSCKVPDSQPQSSGLNKYREKFNRCKYSNSGVQESEGGDRQGGRRSPSEVYRFNGETGLHGRLVETEHGQLEENILLQLFRDQEEELPQMVVRDDELPGKQDVGLGVACLLPPPAHKQEVSLYQQQSQSVSKRVSSSEASSSSVVASSSGASSSPVAATSSVGASSVTKSEPGLEGQQGQLHHGRGQLWPDLNHLTRLYGFPASSGLFGSGYTCGTNNGVSPPYSSLPRAIPGPGSSSSDSGTDSSPPSSRFDHGFQVSRERASYQQERIRLGKDEKIAREAGITFDIKQEIVNLPMDEFNDLLAKHDLTEEQLNLCRDIRRRGKNKVAAQNCRKRKIDQIDELQDRLEESVKIRNSLKTDHERLLSEYKQEASRLNNLTDKVLSHHNKNPDHFLVQVFGEDIKILPKSAVNEKDRIPQPVERFYADHQPSQFPLDSQQQEQERERGRGQDDHLQLREIAGHNFGPSRNVGGGARGYE